MADADPSQSDLRRGGVRIRDVEDRDLDVFFAHQIDPEATRMAAFPARERAPFMAHWGKIRADQTVVIQTILVDADIAGHVVSWERSGQRLVGYWVGRDYWGRGVATAALALFLGRVASRPLHAYVATDNVGSIRVLEKCGFRPVAAPDHPSAAVVGEVAGAGEIEEIQLVLES